MQLGILLSGGLSSSPAPDGPDGPGLGAKDVPKMLGIFVSVLAWRAALGGARHVGQDAAKKL